MSKLTYAEARRLFEYEPASGLLTWRVARGTAKAGDAAGNLHKKYGYLAVGAAGKVYKGHRVVWLLMTGAWPEHQIDHVNGIPADNRWVNLRAATNAQNARNSAKYSNNTSGYTGVCKYGKRFGARIRFDGDLYHLGCYDTPEEASERYAHAAATFFGEFARQKP